MFINEQNNRPIIHASFFWEINVFLVQMRCWNSFVIVVAMGLCLGTAQKPLTPIEYLQWIRQTVAQHAETHSLDTVPKLTAFIRPLIHQALASSTHPDMVPSMELAVDTISQLLAEQAFQAQWMTRMERKIQETEQRLKYPTCPM